MYQDKITRFLDASRGWEREVVLKPNTFELNKFPGTPKDCFLFQRACNIDEMETEADEQYIFTTPDYKVRTRLNRFQTRIILSQFGPDFSTSRIEMIIKMAWNYPKLAINQKTAEFEPFNDGNSALIPPIPPSGSPPHKIVYIED